MEDLEAFLCSIFSVGKFSIHCLSLIGYAITQAGFFSFSLSQEQMLTQSYRQTLVYATGAKPDVQEVDEEAEI